MVMENGLGAHIVDGPTGPPRVIKPGLILLAQKTSAAIVAGYISYENPWVFNSWDRFMIPKPFSRVCPIRAGPLMPVAQEMDEDEFERVRLNVEQEMIKGYEEGKPVLEPARRFKIMPKPSEASGNLFLPWSWGCPRGVRNPVFL